MHARVSKTLNVVFCNIMPIPDPARPSVTIQTPRVLGGGADGGCATYHAEKLPRSCPLYDLALDPLGAQVVGVAQDGALRFWDVATGNRLGAIPPEAGAGAPELFLALC